MGCVVQADGHEWIHVDSTGVRITYCVSSRLLVVGTFFEGCAGDTCVPRVEARSRMVARKYLRRGKRFTRSSSELRGAHRSYAELIGACVPTRRM
jgi:hypothetical protein